MKWTPEQRQAIEYGGENILLAAAAGSGKTAVLVQRIIELICREEDPFNINELLVLTYTDAAAREMREKISRAVEKALRENPQSEHLQKQKVLIHSANISTVHSFCLGILKSNIHLTDIPVNFTLVSETENLIMLEEALDRVLERFYGRIKTDPSIENLVMGFGGTKNDKQLRELVLSLYNFSRSMAHPAKWLNEAVREYKTVAETNSINDTYWSSWLIDTVSEYAAELQEIYEEINETAREKLTPDHPYTPFFLDELASLGRVFDHMGSGEYSVVRDALFTFDFAHMPSGKRGAEGEMLFAQEKIKGLRNLAKDIMNNLWELYKLTEEEMVERLAMTYPVLRTLKNIVLVTMGSHTKAKREKNYLDFSDLEHEAFRLLEDKQGNRTPAAKELADKFREILVDEYQDTNHIQDSIFRAVSRDNSNIFMVGDLKQSIYAFRNAVPKLFSDKYDDYGKEGGQGHLIRLFKNFRSRKAVVDTANYIFDCCMSRKVGNVDYREDEYLIQGANYPELPDEKDYTAEFHFICANSHEDVLMSSREMEATVAAKRILEIVQGGMLVFDKAKEVMRPAEYRDIVVLMRNTKTPAPIFQEVFERYNIPVYADVGQQYLGSREVETVLSFLQIIDNPRQDIPLIAVMRSPLWGFSPEELAEIRTKRRKCCFYDAVLESVKSGDEKATEFVDALNDLRDRAETQSVCQIIWSIYYEFGYYSFAGAQKGGDARQANLRLLYERATEFENTGICGLFGFINYIQEIISSGGDLAPAKTLSEGDNVVRIMTIHKSKGLEFPVVILADTAHNFNVNDLSKPILWHADAGIGAEYTDIKRRIRYSSISKDIVAAKAKSEQFSEEMRLLYVALTRAREKLIVTMPFKKTKSGPDMPKYDKDGRALAAQVRTKHNYRDWMMAALFAHPGAGELRDYFNFSFLGTRNADFPIDIKIYESEDVEELEIRKAVSAEHVEEMCQFEKGSAASRLEYTYPDAYLGKTPIKLSVSEVKRMQTEEEYVRPIESLESHDIRTLDSITPSQRGTIIHFVLQGIEPTAVNSARDVSNHVNRLVDEGVLTSAQAEAVDTEMIYGFFASELGRRMKNALRLEREFSFYTTATLDEVYNNGEDGNILLQGTMDCFFVEEDGSVVLIDFKTDKCKNPDDAHRLAERYGVQMKYYKKALAEILEREVDQCYLYFLDAGQAVKI